MALYEQWGNFGTAGLTGWVFSNMAGTIGTESGTTCIRGWTGGTSGTGELISLPNIPYGSTYDGSVYSWKTWSGTASNVHVILGNNGSGTELGFAVYSGQHYRWTLYNSTTGSVVATLNNVTGTDVTAWTDVTVTYTAGGTWTAAWTSSAGTYSTSIPAGPVPPLNTGFVRGTDAYPRIRGYIDPNGGPYGITNLVYPVDMGYSILDYFGSFNDGSNWGSLYLGDYVINPGDVREQSYEPYNTRGWSSAVQYTVDDSTGYFSQMLGYTGGTSSWGNYPVYCDGTFTVRQQWGTTWTTLLTGFVQPSSIAYDYAHETVQFTVDSILAKAALAVVPYSPLFVGTVSASSGGTITVNNDERPRVGLDAIAFHAHEFLWEGSGTETVSVRIEDVVGGGTWTQPDPDDWYASFYLRDVPAWMTVGADVYQTSSSRNTELAYQEPSSQIKRILGSAGIGYSTRSFSGLEPWIDLYRFGEDAVRYYGGERWIDALHDMTSSVGLSYSIDGTGMFQGAALNPDYANIDGTIDFNSAVNNEWSYGWVAPLDSVTIDAGWDNEEERTYSQVTKSLGTGSYYGGEHQRLEARWLDISDAATSAGALADRMIWSYGAPRIRLSLDVEGSAWPSMPTGGLWSVINLPARVPIPEINAWILAGKTYNYTEDITTLDLVNARVINVFRADYSTADGPDVVW